MMSNKELLDIHLGGNMNVGTLTPSAIYDIMASAQKEVLKEIVKRKWINSPMSDKYKSLDDIVLELIKEIEDETNGM